MPLFYKDAEETALKEFENVNSLEAIEAFRIKYLGRKGIVSEVIAKISTLPVEERAQAGKELNILKKRLQDLVDSKQSVLGSEPSGQKGSLIDITLPGITQQIGNIHPISKTMNEICNIFTALGFRLFEGPETETEYNNFEALNIPLDHPSRDAFDTFYLEDDEGRGMKDEGREKSLLRSHTSPAQIRVMQKYKPPVAAIVPGKVYRPDATDASHSFMFHQVEGFLVDCDVRFSDLKGVLEKFAQEMFGPKTKMRFRPHFFPFTEPSAEVDISCIICKNPKSEIRNPKCSVCHGKGWLEVLGCGMVHPNVFKHVGYGSKKFSGFAFGMGVERIAMLKYGIDDIRMFFENDLRFLKQF